MIPLWTTENSQLGSELRVGGSSSQRLFARNLGRFPWELFSRLPVRVAVQARRGTVGGPAGVCNAGVGVEDLGHIQVGLVNKLPQLGNLADLLEGKDLILLVAIDGKAGRVVATVLETGQACRRGGSSKSASKLRTMRPANWGGGWKSGIDSLVFGGGGGTNSGGRT